MKTQEFKFGNSVFKVVQVKSTVEIYVDGEIQQSFDHSDEDKANATYDTVVKTIVNSYS